MTARLDRRHAITLLGGALASCSKRAATGDSTIRVAMRPSVTAAAFYVGLESGYFADNGLDISVHSFPQSVKSVPLLAAGELDLCLTALNPANLSAIAQGATMRVVAARHYVSTECGAIGTIYGRRSVFGDRFDLRDLVGKTVAISNRGTVNELYLDLLLESVGLSQADIRVSALRTPEAVSALLSDQIDAFVLSHFETDFPALSDKIVMGPGLADIHPEIQYNFVIFGARLLQDEDGIGRRFLSAYYRGVRDFIGGKTPQFLYDFAADNRLDIEKIGNACRSGISTDGALDPRGIKLFAQWCVDRGYLRELVPYDRIVDGRFLDSI